MRRGLWVFVTYRLCVLLGGAGGAQLAHVRAVRGVGGVEGGSELWRPADAGGDGRGDRPGHVCARRVSVAPVALVQLLTAEKIARFTADCGSTSSPVSHCPPHPVFHLSWQRK